MNYNKRVLVYTIVAATLTPFAVYLSALTAAIPDNPYSTLLLITLLFSILFIIGSLLLIEAVLSIKSGKHTKETNHDNKKQLKFRQIPIALAAGILIPYLLSNLINLKTMPYGHLFVLLPIVAAFLTDSGAYFVGVAIGKKKAFPNISPNKTVEGYVGGIITGTIGMLLYGIILSYTTTLTIIFPALILYGILGAIMTELGDLIFSLIKRKCDIKDFGQIMPGHGGALDRFDSMTLAAPTMYLLATTIPAIII
jgi:phosphatidate cytidylyltransferase